VTAALDQTTWWLDSGALPDRLVWARLIVAANDSAIVFDCDGHYHNFSTSQEAKLWLLGDEYSLLSHLVEEGEVRSDQVPPSAPNDTGLVTLMVRPNKSLERARGR
jgi:hypothetical protein